MDPTRRLIIHYPSEQQIVRINQIQIKSKGGLPFVPPFNYREGGPPLSLILDTISEPLYGVELYLGVSNKAAAPPSREATTVGSLGNAAYGTPIESPTNALTM